jgi:hypothetical protein
MKESKSDVRNRNSPQFIELEVSLPCSQEPATGPCWIQYPDSQSIFNIHLKKDLHS